MLFRGIGAAPGLALANCLIIQPLPDPRTVPQSVAGSRRKDQNP